MILVFVGTSHVVCESHWIIGSHAFILSSKCRVNSTMTCQYFMRQKEHLIGMFTRQPM